MGNLFTSQATISFSERIVLRVLLGFHSSDPKMSLFAREGTGREAVKISGNGGWALNA
jgi:hypothetical protein